MKVVVVGAAGQLGRVTVERGPRPRGDGADPRRGGRRPTPPRWSGRSTRWPGADPELRRLQRRRRRRGRRRRRAAVNALAVRSLAAARPRAGATLVHYSTDFVFDGAGVAPYIEDRSRRSRRASTAPRSWSASGSPRDAPRAYVLRVESLFGGVYVAEQRRQAARRPRARRAGRAVFADRTLTPSYVDGRRRGDLPAARDRRAGRASITASTAA